MRKLTLSALRNDGGATAIEYALIATMISFVIIIAVALVGTGLQARFVQIASLL